MQIIFVSKQKPADYANKDGSGEYPDAPKKCPYKDCGVNLTMKKNGYYLRFLITVVFSGRIRIRRYVCKKCGRTVSMLPSFCLAGYSYGVELIIGMMRQVIETGSVRSTAKEWRQRVSGLSRRHITLYLRRLRENRKLIQYGINQISPENINIGSSPGDAEWTKRLLLGIRPTISPEFNANFHKATGTSFMSLQIRIA